MANSKIDKEALRQKILSVEGLDNETRTQLLGLLNEKKRYGLVWEEKPEDVEEQLREKLPVLKEVEERRILSADAESPNHILIEGDNLHALTALTYTHEGKVDVIYIDPPYNTGNKDFIYNDSFVDAEDAYRHSKWLSFMSKRLRIAKKLLSDRGVIFISIDDNEQANLKLLCDEVFGERNFVTKFDWRKKTGANDAKDIATITETVILFTKSKDFCTANNIWSKDSDSVDKDRYKFEDEFVSVRGKYYLDTLDRGGLQYSDSMNFGIMMPDGNYLYPNGRSEFINDGWIWKWGKEKVKWAIENKYVEFTKTKKNKHTSYTIKYKVYEKVDNDGNLRESQGRAFTNLIQSPINQQGNSEMKDLFEGQTPFSNPKPLGLIEYLLKTLKNNSYIILDFFAGSGTTLHATMQLNAEDGGKRQCILVTNNENKICEEVTYERNKRVINGYTTPKGEKVEGLKNNNLRYYKVDFVDRERTPRNMRQLVSAATDLLSIKENLYDEKSEFGALKLKPQIARYFVKDGKQMLVIYREETIERFVEEIEKMDVAEKIKIYLFSPGRYAFDDNFFSVQDKVSLCALPAAIYDAYQLVLPEKPDRLLDEEEENPKPAVQGTLFDKKEEEA